jgi:hypothetical protein
MEQELGPLNGSISINEKCVALMASKSGELSLDAAPCSENNRPLCEVIDLFASAIVFIICLLYKRASCHPPGYTCRRIVQIRAAQYK